MHAPIQEQFPVAYHIASVFFSAPGWPSGFSLPPYDKSLPHSIANCFTSLSHTVPNGGESAEVFMERILGKDYFVMDQWQLEELAKVCRKAKVKIVSDGLAPETINRLFVESAPSVEAALAESIDEYGQAATVAVIPKGPYVLSQIA